MTSLKKRIFLAFFVLSGGLITSVHLPFPKNKLNPSPVISLRLEDRNGVLLREVLSDEGGRCRWVKLGEVSPYALKATIAAEDKNFYLHQGVNSLAVLRAIWQNAKHGRVVSGASTITQQLVRNIFPCRRNMISKLREAWLALRLERTISKEEILLQYINRISYGNQAFGIEAASRLYFDKPSSQLSLAESAFLTAIPRSPSLLNPYRCLTGAKKRQGDILRTMLELGFVDKSEMKRALDEDLLLMPENKKFRASHFCDFVLSQVSPEKRRELSAIQTTLDFSLEEKIEVLLKNYLDSVKDKGISNGALVVLDNTTSEILSLVGSKDFFDVEHDGQVNGALALRQPGSALKPFTYALALERGMTAASLVEDTPSQFVTTAGNYNPQNFDRKYHGVLSLRTALACSYNVPAVSVLQMIGPDLLYQRLKALGFESLKQSPGFYGLGLTLGNGEVSLLELVRAYSALPRQGVLLKEKSILRLRTKNHRPTEIPDKPKATPVIPPPIAYIITDILADKDARIPSFGYNTPLSFPFPVAAKTGTSKDFRDNWAIGYSPKYTVGVWVGNFDGKPMQNVSGISGCGPLFRDIMFLLHQKTGWSEFKEPEDIIRISVCTLTGELPTAYCRGTVEEVFINGTEPRRPCSRHQGGLPVTVPDAVESKESGLARLEVTVPQDGDIFKLDPVLRRDHQRIKLKASASPVFRTDKVEWWINGTKAGEASYPYSLFWNLNPGFYTIKARIVFRSQKIESRPVKILVLA